MLESESVSEVMKKCIMEVKSEKGREPAEHKLIRRWLSAGNGLGGQRRRVSLKHSLCNSGKSLT